MIKNLKDYENFILNIDVNLELQLMLKTYINNEIDTSNFTAFDTAVIIIDMINGFTKEGNFASDRVTNIIPNIVNTINNNFKYFPKVFFRDVHTKLSKENNVYVEHCIKKSETEIVEELKPLSISETILEKNSTNGFLAPGFINWLQKNDNIKNYIVMGCVTDICVSDFCHTLQTFICQNNLDKQVILPIDCVETCDYPGHNAELINIFSLYSLKSAGINVGTLK